MMADGGSQHGRDALVTAAENRRMFNAIARRYDLLNAVLSLGLHTRWRRRAIRELAPRSDGLYLDVGTGTGDLIMEIARQAPGANVIGLDAAARMLPLAARKLASRGSLGENHLLAGDAGAMPFPDGTFAGVVSAFCIRNLEDRAGVFRELHRILQPGGRVVFLDLTRPRNPLLRAGHRLYNATMVPLVGRLLSSGDAYRYLADSIEHFADVRTVTSELQHCGFHDVNDTALHGGIVTLFRALR